MINSERERKKNAQLIKLALFFILFANLAMFVSYAAKTWATWILSRFQWSDDQIVFLHIALIIVLILPGLFIWKTFRTKWRLSPIAGLIVTGMTALACVHLLNT